jgi:1,2-diacylglycerol 3-alpha-glucosyltransferase
LSITVPRLEQPVRIGMFLDMYKPHTSGVTNYAAVNKRYLESLGHTVYVFTFGNRDYEDQEASVVRSPAVAWGDTGWQLGLRPSAEARILMATLDVAHVQHPFLSGRVALAHSRTHGIPVLFTNHTRYDLYSDTYAWYVPRELRMAYLRGYLRRFAQRVDEVIAPSASIAEWLVEFGVTNQAVVLPNGVDTAPFRIPGHPRTRASLGVPAHAVVFCYLGRIGEEKNVELLLDAFIGAAGSVRREIALLLIGDGPEREAAEERVRSAGLADRVRFTGLVPYADVPDVLACCDVFVTASVTEVHPLTVIEAMAAGLPALGVRSPGISDTVEEGISGLLCSEDARELEANIGAVADDAGLRARLAEGASAAASRYDISITGARLLGEYEKVIARHAGGEASSR